MSVRQSTSFSDDEVELLHFLVRTLLRGGDPRMMVRNKAFKGLAHKVHTMQEKIDRTRNTRHTTLIKNEPVKNGNGSNGG